jgi:hypothetical protein
MIAIKDQKLPVVCCETDCGVPLAWRDFNTLSRQNHIKISALSSAAINSYVRTNSTKAAFCTTPNCPIIFRITSQFGFHSSVFIGWLELL